MFGIGLGPDDNWERELQVRPVAAQELAIEGDTQRTDETQSIDATIAQPSNNIAHFCCGFGLKDLLDFSLSPVAFIIVATFHVFNLSYICISSVASAPLGSTHWFKYQLITFRCLNSGAPVFFALSISGVLEKTVWEYTFDETKRKELARMLARRILAFGLIALPVLLTHNVPMGVLYGWTTFLVLGGLFCAVVLLAAIRFFCCRSATERDIHVRTLPESFRGPHMMFRRFILSFLELESKFLATVVRVTIVLGVVFIDQTLFHYGVLYYGGEHSYLEVIAAEYQMRSTACYIASIDEQLRHIATLIPYVSVFIL